MPKHFVSLALLLAFFWAPSATAEAEAGDGRHSVGRMHFEIPHSLPLPKAMHRVELLTSYWFEKYGVRASWNGQKAELSGHIFGMNLDARLEVKDRSVGGDVSDPGFFMRGTARNYLQRKFSTYLDPKNDW